MKLILCSASARRQQLIKLLKMPYIIRPVDVDENVRYKTPVELVCKLALMKSVAGATKFSDGITIGADTIVVSNKKKVIGKPRNNKDAIRILASLSGTVHTVYTGIALIDCSTGNTVVDYEETKVKMRKLSIKELQTIAVKHLDKAGAYAVQETDDRVIEKIYGDYYNVVGLPIRKLKQMIKEIYDKKLNWSDIKFS
jgi:septum formation protein